MIIVQNFHLFVYTHLSYFVKDYIVRLSIYRYHFSGEKGVGTWKEKVMPRQLSCVRKDSLSYTKLRTDETSDQDTRVRSVEHASIDILLW